MFRRVASHGASPVRAEPPGAHGPEHKARDHTGGKQYARYYIENAGGYARNADAGRTHVQYANGSTRVKKKFLFFSSAPPPAPGSVVTVPEVPPADKIDVTGLIADLAQIVAAAALMIAALSR